MRLVGMALLTLAVLLLIAAVGYVIRNMNYAPWDAWKVRQAGFVEKRVLINGSTVNYAEGPGNGPPLLLIHGQMADWRSWNRVLPALIAGHSSGGLIAALIVADRPEPVSGVVLEDPPFFSSVMPRAENTFNYVDLSTAAHGFLQSGEDDFVTYYIRHGAIWDLFQDGRQPIQNHALRYRRAHPDGPLKLFFMPPAINESFRSLDAYDPHFGAAFYDGSFHENFDHEDTLRRIRVPAVLIHTNWSYDDEGILLAAMDEDDATRARALIENVESVKVDSGHGFHFEQPRQFVRIVEELEP